MEINTVEYVTNIVTKLFTLQIFLPIQDTSTATLDLTLLYLTVFMIPCEGMTETMVKMYFMEKADQKRTLNEDLSHK